MSKLPADYQLPTSHPYSRPTPGVARLTEYCRRARLSWVLTAIGREVAMSAPDPRHPQVLDRPACTPSAIRAVLAANADADVLRRYDAELDAAYEQARP
jgi:hypothetical protein